MFVGGAVCNKISVNRSKIFVNNQKIVVLDNFFSCMQTLDLASLMLCIQRHLHRLHFKAELTQKDFEVNKPAHEAMDEVHEMDLYLFQLLTSLWLAKNFIKPATFFLF